MRLQLFSLCLTFALWAVPAPARGASPLQSVSAPTQARNVVLLFAGGIRESELMDDPLHAHARFLWNELRPRGVWYPNFYASGRIERLAGHANVMTGVETGITNGCQEIEYPTWVQHWLDYRQESPTSVVEVARTDDTAIFHGSHPHWSRADSGAVYESGFESDAATTQRFIQLLQQEQPRVAILVLNDASFAAEEIKPPNPAYLQAVETADSLLASVAHAVSAMPEYAAETAIFITDHHGRHDDAHGGIGGHGDSCAGCRNITFLAIGPDFPAGRVVDTASSQVDLAQTCAAILQAPLPYGQGSVMEGLFAEGKTPSPPPHPAAPDGTGPVPPNRFLHVSSTASRWPDVVIENGRLHIAWSEKVAGESNDRQNILALYSTDGGFSFTATDTVAAASATFLPARCALTVDQGGYNGCVYGISARTFRPFPSDSSWVWTFAIASRPANRRRIDGPFMAGDLSFLSGRPAITARANQILLCGSTGAPRRVTLEASRPDSLTPFSMILYRTDYPASPRQFAGPTAMILDATGSVAFGSLISPARTILHATRWHSTTHRWATLVPVLDEGWQAIHPTGAADPLRDRRHLFWQDDRLGEGYQIYASRSDGFNGTWLPPVAIGDEIHNAWYPHACARNGIVAVVFEELSGGFSRILLALSRDAGLSWEPPVEIAAGGPLSLRSHPRVAIDDSSVLHIVWQDNSNGEWDILYRRYPLY